MLKLEVIQYSRFHKLVLVKIDNFFNKYSTIVFDNAASDTQVIKLGRIINLLIMKLLKREQLNWLHVGLCVRQGRHCRCARQPTPAH